MGVDCQRDEDHVACEEVADYCVTNCNGACGWVGFVVTHGFSSSFFVIFQLREVTQIEFIKISNIFNEIL
jgi:hypothetical protein